MPWKVLPEDWLQKRSTRLSIIVHRHTLYSAINSVLIYAKADKDSIEDGKTEQPAEKQKKEGPSSSEKVDKMCKFIYSHDTSDRIRTRAMLCHVYHHALDDRWFEARDLMLMSHLQESIQHSDIPTQVCVIKLRLCFGWSSTTFWC